MIDPTEWLYFVLAHPEYDGDEMEAAYQEWKVD